MVTAGEGSKMKGEKGEGGIRGIPVIKSVSSRIYYTASGIWS